MNTDTMDLLLPDGPLSGAAGVGVLQIAGLNHAAALGLDAAGAAQSAHTPRTAKSRLIPW